MRKVTISPKVINLIQVHDAAAAVGLDEVRTPNLKPGTSNPSP